MNKNKLYSALENFTEDFYNRYVLVNYQFLSDVVDAKKDSNDLEEIFTILSKDKKDVIEQLQNSFVVNKLFFRLRNDFVEDFYRSIKDLYHQIEVEKKDSEKMKRPSEDNEKFIALMNELALTAKQKNILKKYTA